MKSWLERNHPQIPIQLSDFAIKLNSSLTLPFTNEAKLKLFYNEFIEHNYRITYHWYKENGYDTVEEWCEIYFKDWDFDKHSTILKSLFKKKYNNIKPVKI